ncbi:hypothetical protein D3C81_2203130 [compost metagenome]
MKSAHDNLAGEMLLGYGDHALLPFVTDTVQHRDHNPVEHIVGLIKGKGQIDPFIGT